MAENETTLPDPRVVITAHKPDGTSTFASDTQITPFHPFGPAASSFATFHTSSSVPVSNTAPLPQTDNLLPRCPSSGVVFCTSDFPPNYSAPMHRTLSIDYACVLAGEIVIILDSGEERVVRAGEMIVQRGTNHQWVNRSEGFTRVLFVMVESEGVRTEDGVVLEETVFTKK